MSTNKKRFKKIALFLSVLVILAIPIFIFINSDADHDYIYDDHSHWAISNGEIKNVSSNKKEKHNYKNGVCEECGYIKGSASLIGFSLSDDREYYCVISKEQNIISITIPYFYNGLPVKEIADRAFFYQSDLKKVDIPRTVEKIGYSVFYNCSSLTSIAIPDSVVEIKGNAFSGCELLSDVVLPQSLKVLGLDVFKNCKMLKYNQHLDGYYLPSKTNEYFVLIKIEDDYVSSFQTHENTELIAPKVFENSKIETIEITDNVRVIGYYSFSMCESLISIKLPQSVSLIGEGAFYGCNSLTTINIPEGVTSIEPSTFENCEKLISVIFSDSLTNIGESAFKFCRSLQTLNISKNILNIGKEAFYGCSSLFLYCENDSKPSGWDEQWNSGFSRIYWSVDVDDFVFVDSNFRYLIQDGKAIITECFSKESHIVIPSVITIDNIGYTVTQIEKFVFENFSWLKSIQLPEKLESIGTSAFKYCQSLNSIEFPSSLKSIGEQAFYQSGINNELSLPDGLVTIGKKAFSNCNMSFVTIPISVTKIGSQAFSYCYPTVIYCEAQAQPVGWDNDWFFAYHNNFADVYWGISQDKKIEKEGIHFVIVDEEAIVTKYIGDNTVVKIPSTIQVNEITYDVVKIGKKAFYNCDLLLAVSIPSTILSIESRSFDNKSDNVYYCAAASQPVGWVTDWNSDNKPVYWGIEYEEIIEQNGVQYLIVDGVAVITKYVGNEAKVRLPSTLKVNDIQYNITTIGDRAFSNCESIKSLTIPSNIEKIESNAFINENINGGTMTIYCEEQSQPSEWNVDWNPNAHSVYWGISQENIMEKDGSEYLIVDSANVRLTRYVGNQKHIVIPKSVVFNRTSYRVAYIGDNAFSNSLMLETIVITNSVAKISDNAFFNCAYTVVYCEGPISNMIFDSLNKVYYDVAQEDIIEQNGIQYLIKKGVAVVTKYVGNDTKLKIPATIKVGEMTYDVKTIGRNAFFNCKSLEKVLISNNVTNVESNAFSYCNKNLKIYCEVESQPSGWSSYWAPSYVTVIWAFGEL